MKETELSWPQETQPIQPAPFQQLVEIEESKLDFRVVTNGNNIPPTSEVKIYARSRINGKLHFFESLQTVTWISSGNDPEKGRP